MVSDSPNIRTGIWKGEIGSEFHLQITDERVSGHFQTIHGRPSFNEKFEVTGFTDGELIGFTVLWKNYHSVTAWAGRYGVDDEGREYIKSLWHIASKYRDENNTEPTEEWNTFLSNQSVLYFHKDVE